MREWNFKKPKIQKYFTKKKYGIENIVRISKVLSRKIQTIE